MFQKINQQISALEPAPFWGPGVALSFTLAYIVVYIAAQAITVTLTGGNVQAVSPFVVPLGIGLAGLINTAVIVQWVRRRAPDNRAGIALRLYTTSAIPFFVVILLGLAGAYLIDLFGVLTTLKAGQIVPPTFSVLTAPGSNFIAWAVAAVVIIVIQPIGEGLLFQGLLYPAIATRAGNWIAILVCAVLYAVVNTILIGQGLPWFLLIQPLLMTLWVGILRAYTKSTQLAIIMRAMFGLFFVLSALILRG